MSCYPLQLATQRSTETTDIGTEEAQEGKAENLAHKSRTFFHIIIIIIVHINICPISFSSERSITYNTVLRRYSHSSSSLWPDIELNLYFIDPQCLGRRGCCTLARPSHCKRALFTVVAECANGLLRSFLCKIQSSMPWMKNKITNDAF